MELGAQSGLLAAIVSAAVAISVWLRGRRLPENTYFIVFSGNLMLHFLASFFHRFSGHAIWFRVDLIASSLLPVTSLLFFGQFLWKEPVIARPYLRTAWVFSGLLVVFLLTPWSQNTATTSVVIAYVFFVLYLCIYLAYVRYRELHSRRERKRLRYLLVVMAVAVTFVLLGMLPGQLGFLRTWGDLVSIFFLYFLGQSLLKFRLLDIQELLGRGLVLIAVALILSLVFGVLVFAAGGSPEVSLFHTFIASFVILILFEPLRDKVEGSTSLLFFRERAELLNKLESLRRNIANIIDLQQMIDTILTEAYDSMRIPQTCIYLLDEGGARYELKGFRGTQPPEHLDLANHRTFFDQLRRTPTVILAETFERVLIEQGTVDDSEPSEEVTRARQVVETLAHMDAGLCVPLVGQRDILGLWNLHDAPGAESFSTEEIARIMAVGEQAAINIENSKAFEKMRERERMAVLGQMSAGLAHEIRNPLGAIKGAAQYLDPSEVDENASEFLQIIIEETDRLNLVVDQFLDYARPFRAEMQPTDINQVVNQTVRLLAGEFEQKNIELTLELGSDLPRVRANGQQLTQVMLNLLKNAVEAMQAGGRLQVRTGLRTDGLGVPLPRALARTGVEIQVTDSGPGIPPEVQQRIFVPFFTTKERGTGLGLAISQRIVEMHGGELRLHSRQDEETTFTIVLPSPPDSLEAAAGDEKDATTAGRQDVLPFPSGHSRE